METSMKNQADNQEWVWVIIERHENQEKLFGQFDQELNESFIPIFKSKEDGLMCLGRMAKQPDRYYQINAVRYEQVAQAAAENKFMIFILDGEGAILKRISLTDKKTVDSQTD